jgi:hypothetical protein
LLAEAVDHFMENLRNRKSREGKIRAGYWISTDKTSKRIRYSSHFEGYEWSEDLQDKNCALIVNREEMILRWMAKTARKSS